MNYCKLYDPSHEGMIARETEHGCEIFQYEGWRPYSMNPYFFGDCEGEYEDITEEQAEKAQKEYLKDVGNMLRIAPRLAFEKHHGQRDLGGHPYIEHIERVADSVSSAEAQIIALLHDIVEDTDVTFSDLIKLGFTSAVIYSLKCLTKRGDEDYFEYIQRVTYSEYAREVKLADLEDNMDMTRLDVVSDKDRERCKKYKKAYQMLDR